MVGVNGSKFPAIRKHLDENIGGVYKDMDLSYVKWRTMKNQYNLPEDGVALTRFPKRTRLIPRPVCF